MKKFIVICLFLIICMFILTACGLEAGTVIRKDFSPAHTTQQTQIIKCGKILIPIINTIQHPDRWYITVSSGEKTDIWEVSESFYNKTSIGEYITR